MAFFCLAFKHGNVLSSSVRLAQWLPSWLNGDSTTHVEIVIPEPCRSSIGGRQGPCLLCAQSRSGSGTGGQRGWHWLTFSVSLFYNWQCSVDDPKYFAAAHSDDWSYVLVPVRSGARLLNFFRAIEGKPINAQGMLGTYLGFRRQGCSRDCENPAAQPSFFCSEAITSALLQQGFGQFVEGEPYDMNCNQLFRQVQRIPHAQVTLRPPMA